MQCVIDKNVLLQQATRFSISSELVGTYCEADDKYYGKYRGIIVGPHKSYDEPRISVKILECLRPPSTTPECGYGYVKRQEYKSGEIHHFGIKDIIPLIED